MNFNIYGIPAAASAIIIFFIIIFIVRYRRKNVGAWQVTLLLISFFIWSFSYSMVLFNWSLQAKVLWFNIAQIGPDFAPIIFFYLALEHSGYGDLLHKKAIYLASIFPLFTTLLMWTNDFHHLLRKSIRLNPIAGNVSNLSIERGPWFFAETIYGYIFICISLYILIRFIKVSSSKRQTLIIIGAICFPIVFNVLDVLNINPLKPYGASSIVFSITGIVLAWGLFREHLLDITPIARTVVLENIGDGVIVLDLNNRIVDVNPASYCLFFEEYQAHSHLVGKQINQVLSFWDADKAQLLLSNNRIQIELSINNRRRIYNVNLTTLYDKAKKVIGMVLIFDDITEVKQANERLQEQLDKIEILQEQLREQAIKDSLTGCYNRHYLNDTLLKESIRADREKKPLGLLMLDIDYFKKINDSYGHLNGDIVLKTIGDQLRRFVRGMDTVFRYGGEEFLLVMPGIALGNIINRAEELRAQIAGLKIPVSLETSISITVSMGISIYPTSNFGIYEVLDCADKALYDAKKSGRNTVIVWKD